MKGEEASYDCIVMIDKKIFNTNFLDRHFFNNFTTNEDITTKFEAGLPHCVRNVTTS